MGFSAFDHDTLAAQGIVLSKGAAPTVDLEPEYIAATDTAAYITLAGSQRHCSAGFNHNYNDRRVQCRL